MTPINWEDSSWKCLSWIGDEEVISLLHTKVYVFSDSVLYLGKMNENPQPNIAWDDKLTWFKSSPEYRELDKVVGESMEFEWNIFPGFTTLQLCSKVQELLSILRAQPENFTGLIIYEYNPQGEWDRVAEQMMVTFAESKHPVFRSTSPISRGVLKSKGGGNLSIHFCADEEKIETFFRTIISVNQLSIYGAVSDLCDE